MTDSKRNLNPLSSKRGTWPGTPSVEVGNYLKVQSYVCGLFIQFVIVYIEIYSYSGIVALFSSAVYVDYIYNVSV